MCWPHTRYCLPSKHEPHQPRDGAAPRTSVPYLEDRGCESERRVQHEPYKRLPAQRPVASSVTTVSSPDCPGRSRFSLGVRACRDEKGQTVQDHPGSAPDRNALNAHPSTVWMIQLGIRVIHSRPYHPQTARARRSLKVELLQGSIYVHRPLPDQLRPMEGLLQPASSSCSGAGYSCQPISPRSFPLVLPIIEYDSDDQVRTVDVNGRISFMGRTFRVGKAGKRVALRPTSTDGVWTVFFSIQPIATVDLNQ